jgi:UDP-2,3-diacylglucosamine hydrolase
MTVGTPSVPTAQELRAAAGWRTVEFISDLHLQAGHPATFDAWRRYMAATRADALFILGDLFEAWIGDDVADAPGFEQECAAVLRTTARRLPVFFLCGNRDFLVGPALAQSTGLTLLADPTVFSFGTRRWLLSHGDALCIEDTEYLAFREKVREAAWQREFLALPLAKRAAIARGMRAESEGLKQTDRVYADVDTGAALAWLAAADAPTLVHGHTHRPAEHALDATHRRIVLSDWDAEAAQPRLEALRITLAGDVQRVRLD